MIIINNNKVTEDLKIYNDGTNPIYAYLIIFSPITFSINYNFDNKFNFENYNNPINFIKSPNPIPSKSYGYINITSTGCNSSGCLYYLDYSFFDIVGTIVGIIVGVLVLFIIVFIVIPIALIFCFIVIVVLKNNISYSALQDLLDILHKKPIYNDIPKKFYDFIKVIDSSNNEKTFNFKCKNNHNFLTVDIETSIKNLLGNINNCEHLQFLPSNNNCMKNFCDTKKYSDIFNKREEEKTISLCINYYQDAFRCGVFSSTSLEGSYFSILNYDYDYMHNNILLFSIHNSCESCKEIKSNNLIYQLKKLNDKKLFYHIGLKKYIRLCLDLAIVSCDSPEENKITYNFSYNSNKGYCSRCYANSSDISDFTKRPKLKSSEDIVDLYLIVKKNFEENKKIDFETKKIGIKFFEKRINIDRKKKEYFLKSFNPFWNGLKFKIKFDINSQISPDLFHCLFSNISNHLHEIIWDSLNYKDKILVKEKAKNIIY